jgi:hypothetical protein
MKPAPAEREVVAVAADGQALRPGDARGLSRDQHEQGLEAHPLIRAMKEMEMKKQTSRARSAWVGGIMAALVLIGTMAGCAVTQKESVQRVGPSGFLGDTALLTPGDREQASLRYINPAATWTMYNKVLLEPVTFWGDDKTKISAKDQQMLCNFLQEQLYQQLSTEYQLVTEPGEDLRSKTPDKGLFDPAVALAHTHLKS